MKVNITIRAMEKPFCPNEVVSDLAAMRLTVELCLARFILPDNLDATFDFTEVNELELKDVQMLLRDVRGKVVPIISNSTFSFFTTNCSVLIRVVRMSAAVHVNGLPCGCAGNGQCKEGLNLIGGVIAVNNSPITFLEKEPNPNETPEE